MVPFSGDVAGLLAKHQHVSCLKFATSIRIYILSHGGKVDVGIPLSQIQTESLTPLDNENLETYYGTY